MIFTKFNNEWLYIESGLFRAFSMWYMYGDFPAGGASPSIYGWLENAKTIDKHYPIIWNAFNKDKYTIQPDVMYEFKRENVNDPISVLDNDGMPCYRSEGVGNGTDPRFRLIQYGTNNIISLNDALTGFGAGDINIDGFSLQMTCTYEQFRNWGAIMGRAQTYLGYGLSMGQYDNGIVGWGFYPTKNAQGNIVNQHKRIEIPQAEIQGFNNGKFNWAFTYRNRIAKLYINGVYKGSVTLDYNLEFHPQNYLSLCYNHSGGDRAFKGNIYSLLMYCKELNNNEIIYNYFADKYRYIYNY